MTCRRWFGGCRKNGWLCFAGLVHSREKTIAQPDAEALVRFEANEVCQLVGVGLEIVQRVFCVGVGRCVFAAIFSLSDDAILPSPCSDAASEVVFADLDENVVRPMNRLPPKQGHDRSALHVRRDRKTSG